MIPRINFRRADEWVIVDIKDASDYIKVEIIHVPTTDDIYVCLVNIGSGTPIISTLELRPLNNSIYDKSEPGRCYSSTGGILVSHTVVTVHTGEDHCLGP